MQDIHGFNYVTMRGVQAASEISDDGLYARAETACWHIGRPSGLVSRPATETLQGVPAILGDQDATSRDLTDLMTRWLRIIAQQQVAAMRATARSEVDKAINLSNGFQLATFSGMARLATRFAPA